MTTGENASVAAGPSAARLPSYSLIPLTLVHAAVFVAMAVVLPWKTSYAFSVPLFALGALHLVVLALAFAKKPRLFLRAWAVLSLGSLVFLLALSVSILSSALYLAELYAGIGPGLAAGLFGFWCLAVLFTLPISWWGLALAWPELRPRRAPRVGAAVLVVLVLPVALVVSRTARAERLVSDEPGLEKRFVDVVQRHLAAEKRAEEDADKADDKKRKKPPVRPLSAKKVSECADGIGERPLTLFVAASAKKGMTHACLQADSPEELAKKLAAHLERGDVSNGAVKLDLVTSVHPLSSVHVLLDALKLRPGRDGVCANERCLLPWQLVALSAFNAERPLPGVEDAAFGVHFAGLRALLGEKDEQAPLERLETKSIVVDIDSFHDQSPKAPAAAPTDKELSRALRLVEAHIARAQLDSGAFRYTLDPFSGVADEEAMNVARQAGTTLAFCELGKKDAAKRADKALGVLRRYERRKGDFTAFSLDDKLARLGHTALPLVALLECRRLVGDKYDDTIARAGRYLLQMQRPDGSFYPELDLAAGEPRGAHLGLYAGGQAVLALVGLEQFAKSEADKKTYRDAAERAMQYFAGPYWHRAPYDFFFVEENWHCLAARAALPTHRNDAYERFCLDYVTFKSRFILDEGTGQAGELSGGYGFSPLFVPHNTATAGFGEALAASLAVRRARNMSTEAERALLGRVLGYLTRHQWTDDACFACARRADTIGGFSESSTSPLLRIDYAQHAWAALGHGARELAAGKDAG